MIRKRSIPLPLLACLLASVAMPAQATTLEEAIAAAMNHAPEIEAARADADAADARIKEARGQGLPSATLSGTIGYGRLDPQGYFGLPAANVTPRAAQLTIEQPLFMGGRVSAGIAQAKAGSEAAHAGESMTRSQIVVATVQAYGDVLTTHRMVTLYEQMVGQMEEIQRQVLEDEGMLLEYSLGAKESYLWAVTADSFASFTLPGRDRIEETARHYYEQLTARNDNPEGESLPAKKARIKVADDEAHAVAIAKEVLGLLVGTRCDGAVHDQSQLRDVVPERRTRVYDVRQVIELVADVGTVVELRRGWSPGTVTALARIDGRAVGILANDPQHLGGAIDARACDAAAEYRRSVWQRQQEEAQRLASLTGWQLATIRTKMGLGATPPAEPATWWQRIWKN